MITIIQPHAFENTDLENVEIKSLKLTALPDYAFFGCNLKTIILPETLNFIGTFCFSESKLNEFKGPSNLEKISQSAFQTCLDLKKVNLSLSTKLFAIEASTFQDSMISEFIFSPNIEYVHSSAFQDCVNLLAIQFPLSILEIGESAFEGCHQLSTVDLANTQCTTIKSKAFSSCSGLSTIIFSEKLTHIGAEAFYNVKADIIKLTSCDVMESSAFKQCTSLYSVDLEETSLAYIPADAFSGDSSLSTVTLPRTIRELRQACFINCISLSEINFPDSLQTIAKQAFKGCSYLQEISLEGTHVDAFEEEVFYGCSSLAEISWPIKPESIALKLKCFSKCGIVTMTLPRNIVLIGYCSFEDCREMTNADLSQVSARAINKQAFNNCVKLEELILSDNIEELGEYAFSAVKLRTFKNSKIKKMARYVFYNAKALEKVDLRGCSFDSLPYQTFYSCIRLTEVNIADTNITSLVSRSFIACSSLTNVILPRVLETVLDSVFQDCTSLQTIDFSMTNLREINSQAFLRCYSLKEIKWSKTIKRIRFNVIERCYNFETIVIPASVTQLEKEAFVHSGVIKADLRDYRGNILYRLFFNCTRLQEVLFPRTPYTIEKHCFQMCIGMKSLIVNKYCTEMFNGCFRGMYDLEFADLGQTQATYIPESLFDGNSKLDTLILPPNVKLFVKVSFFSCPLSNVYYAGNDTLDGVACSLPANSIIHVLENFTGDTFCGRAVVKDYILPVEEDESSSLAEETSTVDEEDSTIHEEDSTNEEDSTIHEEDSNTHKETDSDDTENESSSLLKEEVTSSSESRESNGFKEDDDIDNEAVSIGAIAGGSIGGAILFIGAIVAACLIMKNKNEKKKHFINDFFSEFSGKSNTGILSDTLCILSDTQINLINPSTRTMWNDYIEDSNDGEFFDIDIET